MCSSTSNENHKDYMYTKFGENGLSSYGEFALFSFALKMAKIDHGPPYKSIYWQE